MDGTPSTPSKPKVISDYFPKESSDEPRPPRMRKYDGTPSTPCGSKPKVIPDYFPKETSKEPRPPTMRKYKKKPNITDYLPKIPQDESEMSTPTSKSRRSTDETPLLDGDDAFNFSRRENESKTRRRLPLEDTSNAESADVVLDNLPKSPASDSDSRQPCGNENDENSTPLFVSGVEPGQSTPRPRRKSKDKAKKQISLMVSPSSSPDLSEEESLNLSDSTTDSSMSVDEEDTLESPEESASFVCPNGDSNLSSASGYSSQLSGETSSQLMHLLIPVRADWKDLAVLLGIPLDTIKVIEKDNPRNTKEQFLEFLREWLINEPKKEALVQALHRMGYGNVCQKVEESDLQL